MSEFKTGIVVCLKSDTAMDVKRYFTIVEVYDESLDVMGFNLIDGSAMRFDIPKGCVDLVK